MAVVKLGNKVKTNLPNTIRYVINPEKNDGGRLVYASYSSERHDANMLAEPMIRDLERCANGLRKDGVLALHLKHSFSPDEHVNAEQVHEMGVMLAEAIWKLDERADMSFKENLQYLRGSRNMTQEQLAMLLGVSRQAISKWESEKAYPEMDKLLMLCDMFGVTLDDLVMGDVRASAGCGGAGRVDLAADTDGVAASVGVADVAVGAVPGVIGFAASQVAGMSDSGESDVRDTNPNVCASVSGESDAQGAKTGVQLSVSPESDMRGGRQVGWNP